MSSSHYTKNGRNIMLKITSSQTAFSPDSNASGSMHTGSTCKSLGCNPQGIAADRRRCLVLQYRRSVVKAKASDTTECAAMVNTNSRKDFLGLALGISSLFVGSLEAKGAGLPPKDRPKLCDEACEKELENVLKIRSLRV
ncbi:hypothetical protein Ahy_B05g075920 [Arachis hypogaea]|uniref:Uncharacterized protein n=1 Tax=Arachis hypogaea TaxID=3818 RepID=A0A444Z2L2_ARAHY|nr:hypothetical protein Ahy_B05g075920 [Arachis hypogaea]